ncbi:MAG: YdeI/OmpD-associated family protein [Candidatus Zixiibacteriota bacterium]
MKITSMITPRNRAEWRQWLAKNHKTVTEVWIGFFKKHTGKSCVSYEEAVEEGLCFGWIDGIVQRYDDERYAQRFTPRRKGSKWSELNLKRVRQLTAAGLMTDAGLEAAAKGIASAGQTEKKSESNRIVVPTYLREALAKNKKAQANFAALPPGYKRLAIKWITAAKKDETRDRRVSEFVRLTAANERIGMK